MVRENPLVTVVIPTWNRAELVQQAIASVEAQTYPNWELVVVDDGSTDATLERLRSRAYSRLSLVPMAHCGDLSRLRNAGAQEGKGELIAFLDSDDVWLPHKLEQQIAALRWSGASWTYSHYGHISQAGHRVPPRAGTFRAINGKILAALLREETAAYIGTLLIERRLFDAIGRFDEDVVAREDLDLALRLAAAAPAVAVADELALVRIHDARMTNDALDPHEETAGVYRRCLTREHDPAVRALARERLKQVCWDGTRYRLRCREYCQALKQLWRTVRAAQAP